MVRLTGTRQTKLRRWDSWSASPGSAGPVDQLVGTVVAAEKVVQRR